MALRLASFCCGCGLKTGALIAACLSIISAVVGVVIGVGGCVQLAMCEDPHELGMHLPVALALFTMILIMTATQMVVSAMLLHGVVKGRARLLLPWLVHRLIALVATSTLALLVVGAHFTTGRAGHVALFAVLVSSSGFFLGVYFLLIVNSYRVQLLQNNPQSKI